jgi:hypothetical protein
MYSSYSGYFILTPTRSKNFLENRFLAIIRMKALH